MSFKNIFPIINFTESVITSWFVDILEKFTIVIAKTIITGIASTKEIIPVKLKITFKNTNLLDMLYM